VKPKQRNAKERVMAGSNSTSQISQSVPFDRVVFLKEILLSLVAALLTGLAGGVLLILLVFGWGNVQAETAEQPDAQLQLRSLDGRLIRQAPLLNTEVAAQMTGPLARVGYLARGQARVSTTGSVPAGVER
jgi:hypothetical protein